MTSRTALLSVRPRFAEALLDGSKTVEIRRRRALIPVDAPSLLYASSPICALVGTLWVATIETDTPDVIWAARGDQTGLSRAEYDTYLEGADRACAIVVSSATRLVEPVSLHELRRREPAFVTPQSYRFLREGEFTRLLTGQTRRTRPSVRSRRQAALVV